MIHMVRARNSNSAMINDHFPLSELSISDTAHRLQIVNVIPPELYDNSVLLKTGLELVRALLGGRPMHITSGYRCLELNRAIGSSDTSAHVQALAADFTTAAFGTPIEIVIAIRDSDIRYDQLIQEGGWVHISFAPALRQQVLTAHFKAGLPTIYTTGVA